MFRPSAGPRRIKQSLRKRQFIGRPTGHETFRSGPIVKLMNCVLRYARTFRTTRKNNGERRRKETVTVITVTGKIIRTTQHARTRTDGRTDECIAMVGRRARETLRLSNSIQLCVSIIGTFEFHRTRNKSTATTRANAHLYTRTHVRTRVVPVNAPREVVCEVFSI